jgi:hypothetical protein
VFGLTCAWVFVRAQADMVFIVDVLIRIVASPVVWLSTVLDRMTNELALVLHTSFFQERDLLDK